MRLSLHIWLLAVVSAATMCYALSPKTTVDKKRCVWFVTIILTLFSGLRSWRMGDVYHYCYAFQNCNSDSWKLDITGHDTVGLQLLFRLIGQLQLSFEVCLFIIAAFAAITLGVFVNRYSTSPYLSYLIYICLGNYIFTLSALKQAIAMGFVTLAMIAVIESKPWRFLLLVGFAALFHTPALIFLPAYIIVRKKIDATYFFCLITIAVATMLFRDQIVDFVSGLYYESESTYDAIEQVGGKFLVMLGILAVAVFIHPQKKSSQVYRYLFNTMVLAAILQSFSVYDNVFTRLSDYYFQFFVVFVPLVLRDQTVRFCQTDNDFHIINYGLSYRLRMIAMVVITAGSIYFYINTLNASEALLREFHFFWENDALFS